MGYIIAFISVFSFALSNCLWVFPLKQLCIWQVMAWRSVITSVLFLSVLLFCNKYNPSGLQAIIAIKSISVLHYAYVFLFCVYCYFGLVFYNLSLKHNTEVSVSVPITYMSGFWGLLTVYFVYNDAINYNKFFVIILFFIALFLIDKNAGYKKFKLSKGIVYALLAAFVWGTSFALFPKFINLSGVGGFSLILENTVCICSVVLFYITKQKTETILVNKQQLLQILPIALCGFLGVLFYNLATQYLLMSTLILLDTLMPAITVIISALLLKEKLLIRQYIAISIIIVAVIILKLC